MIIGIHQDYHLVFVLYYVNMLTYIDWLFHSFHGSRVWAQHNWRVCLGSYKVKIKMLCSFLEALGRKTSKLIQAVEWYRVEVLLLPCLSVRGLFQLKSNFPSSPQFLLIWLLHLQTKKQCVKLFSHFSSLWLPFLLCTSTFFYLPVLPLAWERYLLWRARVIRLGLLR